MTKKLLFKLTKKDFTIQTFRAGGKGGQNQNKTNTGVRIIHQESNARGECRNNRSQLQNKKEAFKRLVNSKEFQLWLKIKTGQEVLLEENINKIVDEQIQEKYLKIEYL